MVLSFVSGGGYTLFWGVDIGSRFVLENLNVVEIEFPDVPTAQASKNRNRNLKSNNNDDHNNNHNNNGSTNNSSNSSNKKM